MCIDGASGRTVHVVCSQSALLGVDPCRGTWHGSQELPHELSWICFCFGFVSPSGKRFAFILLVYCTLSSYRCGYRCELRTPSRLPCFTLPPPCSRKFIILHCGGEGSFPHGLHGYCVRKLNTIQAEQICTTCFLFKWTRLLNRRYCTVHHYDHHGAPSRLSPLHGPIMLQRRRLVNKDIVFRCCRGLPLPQRLDNVRKASNTWLDATRWTVMLMCSLPVGLSFQMVATRGVDCFLRWVSTINGQKCDIQSKLPWRFHH